MHPLANTACPGFPVEDSELEVIKRQVHTGYIRCFRRRGMEPPPVDRYQLRSYQVGDTLAAGERSSHPHYVFDRKHNG